MKSAVVSAKSGSEPNSEVNPCLRRRVLVVDDDSLLGRATAILLESSGWEVELAEDGAAALLAVREYDPQIVLLDLRMPGMNGFAVLERLRALPNPPIVVVLSGHVDRVEARRALSVGAACILEKPVPPGELISLLNSYVRPPPHSSVVEETVPRSDEFHRAAHGFARVPEIIGDSSAMCLLREQVVNVSRYPQMSVLILGETGTGKELVAQAIHRLSACPGELHTVNCSAIPADLFESELFGHERGAFTDARASRVGLFEAASSGTVFLDEVSEMPSALQAKLLRALETRTFRKVGSNQSLDLSARIISATNRSLRGRASDSLRPDLFFRLAGYTIRTSSLRDRMDDVPCLARHFVSSFAVRYPGASSALSTEALNLLQSHRWAGNVRELRSVVYAAAARADGALVSVREVAEVLAANGFQDEQSPAHATAMLPDIGKEGRGIRDMERELVARTYVETGGNVAESAERLKIPRTTLRDKLRRYGLR